MNPIKIITGSIFLSVVFLAVTLSLVNSYSVTSPELSITCSGCNVGRMCICKTTCESGFLDIFPEVVSTCEGIPEYEVTVLNGFATWKPQKEGDFNSRVLCDNGRISSCNNIKILSFFNREKLKEVKPYPTKSKITGYIIYLFILAIVLVIGLLIYNKVKASNSKKEAENIKKKIKK